MNPEMTMAVCPADGTLIENPPRFTWPMDEARSPYTLEIGGGADFSGEVARVEGLPYNFYTMDRPLPPGAYHWRVNTGGGGRFTVPPGLPETPLKPRETRYAAVSAEHPRLWLGPEGVADFRAKLAADKHYCGFDQFYEYSVLPRVAEGFPAEPERYPNDQRVISLWRGNYMTCQKALCYIRSVGVAGIILEDEGLIAKAKAAVLSLASWDAEGATSRSYNDECAFRCVLALAWGYDWLYHHLSDTERGGVLNALFARVKQVADHAVVKTKIHNAPYDSHAVRSLSMALTPCCIAMFGERPEARDWLDYTLEYLSAVYTPWGGADGGWAEGPAYWTTGMAFVTEALNHIKNYLGIDFYKRPFFQRTGEFMLRCNPPDTYYASFCDQSNMGDRPGSKAAFNMRQFAAASGDAAYQWYFNRVMARSEMDPPHFADKGWWDLYFDDMTFRRDNGLMAEQPPDNETTLSWFRDIGWAAINHNAADFDEHVFLLAKCSPYGSVSHSHADQAAFVLFAYGEPLIINSGHYVGFGSTMHLNWRRQTVSANTLLIDGLGQYGGSVKSKQLAAKGEVVSVAQAPGFTRVHMDATAAYRETVPYLERFTRDIYFINDAYALIADDVILTREGRVTAQLHALYPFETDGPTFRVQGGKAALLGEVSASAGVESVTQSDKFDGVDAAELEGLPNQYHLSVTTKPAKRHALTTTLRPVKGQPSPQ